MKKDTILLIVAIILLLAMIGGVLWVFVLGNEPKDSGEVVTPEESVVEQEEPSVEEEYVVDDVEVETDLTFKKTVQSVGGESDTTYILSDINIKKGETVLEIEFTLNSDDDTAGEFLVKGENKKSLNVLEININGIVTSNVNLSYNQSLNVDRSGISGLTRVVNSVSGLEKFYLGVAEEVEFAISEPEVSDGVVVFSIFVKYPSVDFVEVDMPERDLSKEAFEYEGSSDVKITNYKFNWASGVLRFNLEMDSMEMPSINANVDGGSLVVTFPSLKGDSVSGWSKTVALPSGIVLNISRNGSESIYEFVGAGNEFRITGGVGPNQIVIEMKV